MASLLEIQHPDGIRGNETRGEGVDRLGFTTLHHGDTWNLGVKPVMVPVLAPFVHASVRDALVLVVPRGEAKRHVIAVVQDTIDSDAALLIVQHEVVGKDFNVEVPAVARHTPDELAQMGKRAGRPLMQLDPVALQNR